MSYSYSYDEGRYFGTFATPEEAATEAFAGNSMARCWVGEKYQPCAEGYLDADLLIEHIACQDEYCVDSADGWPDATKEQLQDLTDGVRKLFGDWLDRHKLRENFWLVRDANLVERDAKGGA